MPIANLLKSQSNEVYLVLTETGWDVSAFEWLEINSIGFGAVNSAKLSHKPSEYYFVFDNHKAGFMSKFSPAAQTIDYHRNSSSWAGQIQHFKEWLGYLSREVNAPDLWSELPNDSKLIETTADDDDNSKFNAAEKKLVVEGLKEIKQYLLDAHKLDPELIEGQLKYLTDSANRLGRKDWKNILISTIFSIIIQGGIAGHSAQEIFQFVWTVLSAVLVQRLYLP